MSEHNHKFAYDKNCAACVEEDRRSPYWGERDEDGHCTRCGLYVDPEEEVGTLSHECPPGFWTPLNPIAPSRSAALEPFKTVTDHKYISEVCHEKGCQFLVPGPEAYELGRDDARQECAQELEEMAMKYQEVVRWALNKGAQIIRDRITRAGATAPPKEGK